MGRSRIHAAARPVIAAVITTPTVASRNAGFHAARIEWKGVRRPPSNRITASAMDAIPCASG